MTTIAFLPVADGYGFLRSVWQNVRRRRLRRNKERQNEDWRLEDWRFRVSGNIRFVFFVTISSEMAYLNVAMMRYLSGMRDV